MDNDKIIYGPCSTCGTYVPARTPFIGPISFHCKEPPCWPEPLVKLDKYFNDAYESMFKDVIDRLLKQLPDEYEYELQGQPDGSTHVIGIKLDTNETVRYRVLNGEFYLL